MAINSEHRKAHCCYNTEMYSRLCYEKHVSFQYVFFILMLGHI